MRIVSLFTDFKLGPGMALSMLNIGIVALALVLLRTIPWQVSRIMQHTAQRKTTYVSTDQTVEQELRITAGRL